MTQDNFIYERVYMVCHYAAAYGGNFLLSLQSVEKLLKQKKIDVIYIFPIAARGKQWADSIENIEFCEFTVRGLYQLGRRLKTNSIIHTHFCTSKDLIALKMGTSQIDKKIVVHIHMRVDEHKNRNYLKKVIKDVVRKFLYEEVVCICVSNAVYQDMKNLLPKGRIFCVVNAISTERLNHIQTDVQENRPQALIFGTHYERKGVDIAVEAWKKSTIYENLKLRVISHNLDEARILIEKSGETV